MTLRTVNILDRIGSLIPGYIGYSKRDNQRKTDKLLRFKIASQLEEVQSTINSLQKKATRGDVDCDLMILEELRKASSTLCSKIRHAAYGASALFESEQIKEDELHEIYRLDEFMLDQVEHLKLLIEQDQETNFLVAAIRSKLKEVEKAFNERENFIRFNGIN